MKRLTYIDCDGWYVKDGFAFDKRRRGKEIDRLAEYEDLGLTPEEIKALILVPNSQLTLETMREVLDEQREVAEEIAEDFIDFVTGGVYNAAQYCANMRPECCESPGWCTGASKECKGFFPKAAKGPEEGTT